MTCFTVADTRTCLLFFEEGGSVTESCLSLRVNCCVS